MKVVLKEKKIRFQTPFPARLRVFYSEGTVLYGSPEEATGDMAKRGLSVTVIKHPGSQFEQIQRFTWRTSRRLGNWERRGNAGSYKEKLQMFKRLIQHDCKPPVPKKRQTFVLEERVWRNQLS